jgi:O-antigen ligase
MTKFSTYLFYFAIILIPSVLIEGSLITFSDAKNSIFYIVAATCCMDLLFRAKNTNQSLNISSFHILLAVYVTLRVLLIFPLINFGFQTQSIFLEFSSLLIGIWAYNTHLNIQYVIVSLALSTISSLICTFYFVYFRIALLSNYSALGGTVGLKNSLSVYLALVIPYLLLGINSNTRFISCYNRPIKVLLRVVLLTSLCVIVLSRTRSAWIMLIFVFLFFLLKQHANKNQLNKVIKTYLNFSILAIILSLSIPNTLKWHSKTPFYDSLVSITDLSKTNGRDSLWQVGLKMFEQNFYFGTGSGTYPLIWQDYIKVSGVEPKSFAFLRPDLNLFNDYLQAFVENGGFTGLIFISLYLLFPVLKAFKCSLSFQEIFFISSCLAMSIDSFFDHPFKRPESILIFTISTSLMLKTSAHTLTIPYNKLKVILPIFIFCLFFVSAAVGTSVYLKRDYAVNNNLSSIKKAILINPWSFDWNSNSVNSLLKWEEVEFATNIADSRIRFWPNDPEGYLMKAKLALREKDENTALDNLRRALNYVENGRCYFPAFKFLKSNFKNYEDLASYLGPEKLKNCN